MSRTDKDVPYWVRLNNEGTLTDHDHLRFGKEITQYRYVRDENGKRILNTVATVRTAREIMRTLAWNPYAYTQEIRDEAKRYTTYTLGYWREYNPDHQIRVGTRSYYEKGVVVTGHVRDYCTAGVKLEDDTWRWWSELPCTPELPAGKRRQSWTRNMSKHKTSFSRMRYSAERANRRDHFISVANHWNNGFEVDDWDENDNLTAQHRHSMAWDLY